ncbi:MAG: hypothetical protein WBD45_12105 [Terriglobales bacterium]
MPTPPITFHRCQHIKVNGIQCGSPALRAKRCCFFHQHCAVLNNKIQPELIFSSSFEDANSIQLGIGEVIRLLVMKHVDLPTATLLLRALRLAAANVKFTSFEPKSAQVVVDPTAVEDRFADGPATFDPDYETAETLPETLNETNRQKSAVDNQPSETRPPNKTEPIKNGAPQYIRELIRRFHENSEQMRLFKKASPSESAKLSESATPLESTNPPESTKLSASAKETRQHDSNLHDSNFHDSNFQDAAAADLKIPNPSTFPNSEINQTAQESCH